MKYHPEFPIGLAVTKMRTDSAPSFSVVSPQHHHSGLGYLTPYQVHWWRKSGGINGPGFSN